MYRLFVSLDLSEDVKKELQSFSFGLPGAKWVPDEQFHLTLHFIGNADSWLYDNICESLADVKFDDFQLQLSGLGVFPPRKNPKVLWVGVSPCDQLIHLHKKIGAALKRAEVRLEKRKFSPHITLARLKNSPTGRVANFLAAHNLYRSSEFTISDFKLYSSTLTAKGAIHTIERIYR